MVWRECFVVELCFAQPELATPRFRTGRRQIH